MQTKYPIVLVHGIILKDIFFVRAFGRIQKILEREGHLAYTADIDGFGTVETNAEQLKGEILRILGETGAEKVNLIAHSKGGIDSKYMLQRLGMEEHVASLTTLATPHRGAKIATTLGHLPRPLAKFIAFWINFWYRLFRDKHPDALAVCHELSASPNELLDSLTVPQTVYCQSYSVAMERGRDDFIMSIPYAFTKHCEGAPSDGIVSVESSQFANYRGNAVEGSVSHSEIVGYSLKKKKRERVYSFYRDLAQELASLGF